MDIVTSGSRAFEVPSGSILSMRQHSPGAIATAALASQDGATGFTLTALVSSTPVTVGPFTADCRINVNSVGAVAVDVAVAAAASLIRLQMLAGGMMLESATDNITAHSGGGQGSATALVSQTNRITTVAAKGDSVVLPASAPGLELLVINHGVNPMQVFGLGTDTVDDAASATGVSQMQGSFVLYSCATAGAWYTEGLATGYAAGTGLPTYSSTDNMTATASGTQGTSLLLSTVQNRITTVTTAGDSVKLPIAAPGLNILVANAGGGNSMGVFPGVGDQINGGGANVVYALASGKTVEFWSASTLNWHALLSA